MIPRGIFHFDFGSGSPFSAPEVSELARTAVELGRPIHIEILNGTCEIPEGTDVKSGVRGDEVSPPYDYALIAVDGNNVTELLSTVPSMLADDGWMGLIFPQSKRDFDTAHFRSLNLLNSNEALSAVGKRDVSVQLGANLDVLFCREARVFSVMHSTSGNSFWKSLWRATDKFGVRAAIQNKEVGGDG